MGGNHKRNIRAEKAKVKLKGSNLPKGLNVTKTDFKVRKIVIREQLKESQYIEGQKQIHLKEILNKLKHHSPTHRSEALRKLKEAIISGHRGIIGQLSAIMQSVSAIALDVEKDVRKECFKTLSSLLFALDEASVSPFFHILSTYLRCAMTHIQPSIQEDALKMLDVLLEHVPNLVAANSEKIFKNFLEMISRVRADGDRAGRTLTVHMGKHQTSIKWRSKILLRLQHMLQTLVISKQSNCSKSRNFVACRTVTFNSKTPQFYNVTCKNNAPDLEEFFDRSFGTNNVIVENTIVDHKNLLQNYIQNLMPLIIDAWLEVRPSKSHGHSPDILTQEASYTLQIVLEIIKSLWILVDQYEKEINNNDLSTWFCGKYAEIFAKHFLYSAFPYQQNEEVYKTVLKKVNKDHVIEMNPCCQSQNILLCYLLCRFVNNTDRRHDAQFPVLLDYLVSTIANVKKFQNEQQQQHIVLTLRSYLLENGMQLLGRQLEHMRSLLRATINAVLIGQFSHWDGISAAVLVLLCEIVISQELFNIYGYAEFTKFLEYLPQLLLKGSITENTLLAMSKLGKQKNNVFLKALEVLLPAVIENISKIQVIGAITAFEGKKHIMNLFYWTEKLWQNIELIQMIDKHISDKRIVSYFKYILMA